MSAATTAITINSPMSVTLGPLVVADLLFAICLSLRLMTRALGCRSFGISCRE